MQPQPMPSVPAESQPRSRRRSYFVPGFALGFLLLAALSCSSALYAAGIDATRLAELRGGSTAWTPPPTPISLTLRQPSPDTGELATGAYAFRPGDRPLNMTSSLVNIRTSPGYLGKSAGDVVAQATPGQQVEILDGPQSADGLTWWYVQLVSETGTQPGWIAEATASGVQILGQ